MSGDGRSFTMGGPATAGCTRTENLMLHPDMLAAIARDRLAHEYHLAETHRALTQVRRARRAKHPSPLVAGETRRSRMERRRAWHS
jgi:hypothetical protein